MVKLCSDVKPRRVAGEELHEVLGIDLESRRSNLHGLLSGQRPLDIGKMDGLGMRAPPTRMGMTNFRRQRRRDLLPDPIVDVFKAPRTLFVARVRPGEPDDRKQPRIHPRSHEALR